MGPTDTAVALVSVTCHHGHSADFTDRASCLRGLSKVVHCCTLPFWGYHILLGKSTSKGSEWDGVPSGFGAQGA